MALWRLYYHVVWATKERHPFITTNVEPLLYGYIGTKVKESGCLLHAIGGIEDHIHLVVSIPPKLSIADFVKNIKGSSAHYLNHETSKPTSNFSWQFGYGVFSMGSKQLDEAVAYVLNQKAHHGNGSLITALERDLDEDDKPSLYKKDDRLTNIRK